MAIDIPDRPAIRQALVEALDDLYVKDIFLLKQELAERAIVGPLYCYLRARVGKLCQLHVDTEWDAMTDEKAEQIKKKLQMLAVNGKTGEVYPDIIIHNRPDSGHNTLVIEVKIDGRGSTKDRNWAMNKLRAFTTPLDQHGRSYRQGCFLDLGVDHATAEWFEYGHGPSPKDPLR